MGKERFLFLPSNSSKSFHKDNTLSKFTTRLFQPLTLKPGYEYRIGLAELSLPGDAIPNATQSDDCYVYCSLCCLNYVGDSFSKLLRTVRISKTTETYSFPIIFFHEVELVTHVTDIEIKLARQSGENFPFRSSTLPSIATLCIDEEKVKR